MLTFTIKIEREGLAEAFQKESADKPKPQKPALTAKNAKKRKLAAEKENNEEVSEAPSAPPPKGTSFSHASALSQRLC